MIRGRGDALPLPDADRLRALRRMKAVAGGFLLFAAAVYLVCRLVWNGAGAGPPR